MLGPNNPEREHWQVRRDRVAEDIYVFVSDLYAQATCTVLLTDEGAIVIDTMPFPSETQGVVSFIERQLGRDRVRYVINTHHHADHVYGTYLFQGAETIAHDACREFLGRVGRASLQRAKRDVPDLADVELRLPDLTFASGLHLQVGHRHLQLFHTPGHTADGISVFVSGAKVLIAGDALMPVPHIVGGDIDQLKASLLAIKAMRPAFIVQGHGSVLLRGEVNETINSSVAYLNAIGSKVRDVIRRGDAPGKLREISIESCGISRIPLDGMVSKFHLDNLVALYKRLSQGSDRAA